MLVEQRNDSRLSQPLYYLCNYSFKKYCCLTVWLTGTSNIKSIRSWNRSVVSTKNSFELIQYLSLQHIAVYLLHFDFLYSKTRRKENGITEPYSSVRQLSSTSNVAEGFTMVYRYARLMPNYLIIAAFLKHLDLVLFLYEWCRWC